jgi:hypothetical protein
MAIPSIQDVAAIATAIGVFFAAIQLWHTRNRAVTTFEDSLANEYRKITGRLPTEALLGEILTPDVQKTHFHEFYRYFDLTNSQIFLRQSGRISKKTWKFWAEGIQKTSRVRHLLIIGPRLVDAPVASFPSCGG